MHKPNFKKGDTVFNFNNLGKVIEVTANGDLILLSVGLNADGSRWLASPDKCRHAHKSTTATMHKLGLVTMNPSVEQA